MYVPYTVTTYTYIHYIYVPSAATLFPSPASPWRQLSASPPTEGTEEAANTHFTDRDPSPHSAVRDTDMCPKNWTSSVNVN